MKVQAKNIKLSKSPWLELSVMVAVVTMSYIALLLISKGAAIPPGGMTLRSITVVLLGCFLLAFTPIDSLIVRATGLVVAMFSGLIATGPFTKSGLGNLKLSTYCCCGYGVGAFMGAQGAIWAVAHLEQAGKGIIRIILGGIVFSLAIYFLRGSRKIEWPEARRIDRFTQWLGLTQPYYEESLGKVVDYQVTGAGWGLLAMCGVGLIAGFFGLGAGWAIVPTMNLIMAVPLKVAVACSGILIGMGDCIAVWPYLLAGAIIPLFAAPWLAGQFLGGTVGAHVLIRAKSTSIRFILIGIMIFSSFGLVTKGLKILGYISAVPGIIYVAVLLVIMTGVALAITGKFPKL